MDFKLSGSQLVRIAMSKRKWVAISIICCLMLLIGNSAAQADAVGETLHNGVMVTAEYRQGAQDKPALVVLHGFLQTNSFQATYNIVEGLAGLGYTVIAPNLSLGVPNRKNSLQCDAIHQHTLADDISEIDFWAQWILSKGYKKIIFVGHSWGSQHALAYMSKGEYVAQVAGILAISLVPDSISEESLNLQIKKAQTMESQSSKELGKYVLSFCKDYTATPRSYLSYSEWRDAHLLNELGLVTRNGTPVYAILGSADKRLRANWSADLQNVGVTISIVEGANHFFSSSYEFDLIDQLEIALKTFNLGAKE